MKIKRWFNVLAILVMLSMLIASAPPAAAQTVSPGAFVPGEVIVGFMPGKTLPAYAARAAGVAASLRGQVVNQTGDTALLSFEEDADVLALSERIQGMEGVAFAEPNYVYSIPTPVARTADPAPVESVTRRNKAGEEPLEVSVDVLKSMRTVRNGRITATYPNDPYLWWNWGWSYVGADIVSPNTTASAGVCVLDTGVDYSHPDLGTNIIKGYDFVNADADPMDDNGHGTHVAGIISAKKGNAIGIAGVSSGKVVAVKVLNAQGWGTSFNIASGINYCANRTDVKVLNMSLGGSYSIIIHNVIEYAVNYKNKLLVAAAGNDGTSDTTFAYPAALSTTYPHKVLAVAAEDDWGCQASFSNYGSWVTVAAPGVDIYSTMPYNKPFYLNYYYGISPDYDWLSGTSMAAPFVAAAAARRWGYQPAETNAQVGAQVAFSGWSLDGGCWDSSMTSKYDTWVPWVMDRGAMYGFVYNATTGLPLTGAKFEVYQGTSLKGTGLVSSIYSAHADVINLPAWQVYTAKVHMTGMTAGSQPAFWHTEVYGNGYVYPWWNSMGRASVPNKSGNFDVVAGWWNESIDLDLNVWLPTTPNPYDPGQPAPFIVGPEGDDFDLYGPTEDERYGTLVAFPFASWNREGGWSDWLAMESTTISKRLAHAPLAANAALPYYAGYYFIGITDYGWNVLYDAYPFVYIWKDGIIKTAAANYGGCYYTDNWWFPFRIESGSSGTAPTYTWIDYCGDYTPYTVVGALGEPSGMGVFKVFGRR